MNVQVLHKVLARNEHAADENRAALDRHGVLAVNILGGAGCGKTTLLEHLLPRLKRELRIAVLEGDLATTRDADRIAALEVTAVQLLTDGGCHLNATHVQAALAQLDLETLDLLVVENVGNPICPANFALGEHRRISVLSVTEGDDKPSKYPLLFKDADLVVLTKCDLLPYVRFDVEQARADMCRVNPGLADRQNAPHRILQTGMPSTGTESGIAALADWFLRQVRSARLRCPAAGRAD